MTKVETPLVLRTDDGPVRTLTLNRGERFSPLSSAMIAVLQAELDAVAADESIRAVILAGRGQGFCAGHDLKEMRAHAGDAAWQRRLFDDCSHLMMTLTRIPQPVVARVHGIATAAGCQLVAMCDLAVANMRHWSIESMNVPNHLLLQVCGLDPTRPEGDEVSSSSTPC